MHNPTLCFIMFSGIVCGAGGGVLAYTLLMRRQRKRWAASKDKMLGELHIVAVRLEMMNKIEGDLRAGKIFVADMLREKGRKREMILVGDMLRERELFQAQYERIIENLRAYDLALSGRRTKAFDFNRVIDFAGAPFPLKIRERIFTPYAEELKEDHALFYAKCNTPWERRYINSCTVGKLVCLSVCCWGSTISKKTKAWLMSILGVAAMAWLRSFFRIGH